MIPIVILAAGQSSRMRGGDKLLEEIDGQPLIRRLAAAARKVSDDPVIVALPPAPNARHDALAGLDVNLLEVDTAEEGMNGTLRDVVASLPDAAGALMLVLGDLPELSARDLRQVLEAVDLDSDTLIWRGATEDGKPGHPVVFSAALFDRFADLYGDGGARKVVEAARGKVRLVRLPGTRALTDLDTPEEWAAWRAKRKNAPTASG